MPHFSYTTNYIKQDPNPSSDTDFMGNVVQSFVGQDGKHLGPICGLNWVEVGESLYFLCWRLLIIDCSAMGFQEDYKMDP